MIISFSNPILPKNNLSYELDFQYDVSSPIWTSAEVTVTEALDVLKTGLLENKPVGKIKLFAIFDEEVSIEFVYDVRAAKQGNIPWSLEQTILTVLTENEPA